jgi:hypothetical protein
MTIFFDNGMGLQTDTNFRILGTDGTTVRSSVDNAFGGLEKSQPVWRCVYNITSGVSDGNQGPMGSGKLQFRANYGGEGDNYNFTNFEFICPVPGNYRMSMHVLHTGGVYAEPNNHSYGYINGTFISNGIHCVGGGLNYATCQWIGVVRANAGDYLWFGNNGGRMYTGGWQIATYQLLG